MKRNVEIGVRFLSAVVLAMFISLPLHAQHQDNWDVVWWPEGEVVMTNGDTIYGGLTLYRSQDVVSVQGPDSSINFYSPVHVKYFVAIEQPSGKETMFRTLPWNMGREFSDFKKPTFFEQLNTGAFTLMRREGQWVRNPNRLGSFNAPSSSSAPQAYPVDYAAEGYAKEFFYMLLPNGEVKELRNVRKNLLELFGKKSKKVKAYVKKHNLDYDRPHRLVAIVNYYNTL